MLHYVSMEQRASLDDLCTVHISRYRGNQIFADTQADVHGPRSQSLPLLASHPSPHTEPRAPRPPLPEPGCGCSVDGDILPKPSRPGQRLRIPRPRTAFILFRCDFVHQQKMSLKEAENDHISRRAGHIWNQMTPEEKQPWVKMAEREKQRHATLYPNYKYMPNPTNFKLRRIKLKGPLPYKFLDPQAFDFVLPVDPRAHECGICGGGSDMANSLEPATCRHLCSQLSLKRRPSSCPPIGATPVPDLDLLQSWLPPVVSQDDLHRRSSQATMYRSITYPSVEPVVPNAHIPLPHGDDSWFGMPQPYLWELDDLDSSNSDFPLGSTLSEGNPQLDTTILHDNLRGMEPLNLESTFVDPSQFPFTSPKIVGGNSPITTTTSDIHSFTWPLLGPSDASPIPVDPVSLPRPRRNAIVEHAP